MIGPHRAALIAAALLAIMAANLLAAISRKTITNDEIVFIPAGYYHLVRQVPVQQRASAARQDVGRPAAAGREAGTCRLPRRPEAELRSRACGDFTRGSGRPTASASSAIAFWPRVWMIPLAIALGALIFVYARRLFGPRAAMLAVALYAFEPTMLAHGRIVHTDVPAALAYLGFFVVAARLLDAADVAARSRARPRHRPCVLTKFSLVVLLPMLALRRSLYAIWAAPVAGAAARRSSGSTRLGLLVILLVRQCRLLLSTAGRLSEADVHRLAHAVGRASRPQWLTRLLARLAGAADLFPVRPLQRLDPQPLSAMPDRCSACRAISAGGTISRSRSR